MIAGTHALWFDTDIHMFSEVKRSPVMTITGQGARSDVSARGFWTPMQGEFFDIKVTHLNAPSYRQKEPSVVYRLHENGKKRKYNCRIITREY